MTARALFVPERRLAVALAIAAVLWIVPGIGSLLGATALGAIALGVVIDLFRLPSRHSFRIAREAPESTGLGDDAAISYRFTNATAMPLRALAQDRLPPASPADWAPHGLWWRRTAPQASRSRCAASSGQKTCSGPSACG